MSRVTDRKCGLNRFFLSEQFPASCINRSGDWRAVRLNRFFLSEQFPASGVSFACGGLTLSQSLLPQRTVSGTAKWKCRSTCPDQVSIASSSANSFRRSILQTPRARSSTSQSLLPQRTVSGYGKQRSKIIKRLCLNRFFLSEQFPAAGNAFANRLFGRVSIASSSANSFRRISRQSQRHHHRQSLNRFFLSEQFPAKSYVLLGGTYTPSQSLLPQRTVSGAEAGWRHLLLPQ